MAVSRAVEAKREKALPLPARPPLGGKHGVDIAGSLERGVASLLYRLLLTADVLLQSTLQLGGGGGGGGGRGE